MTSDLHTTAPRLQALPYHRAVVAWLRREEPSAWDWQRSTQQNAAHADQVRLDLLKSTYRLDRAAHTELYDQLDACASRLGVQIPITCYQAQAVGSQLNAALVTVPDHAHIIFHGPVLSALEPSEIEAVLGHELGHYLLMTCDDGIYGTAERLLDTAMAHGRSEPSLEATIRRWQLSTELFADRASLTATRDLAAVVRTLVRMETGGAQVHAESYLAQAHEVLNKGPVTTAGTTHPESFIRAAALEAFAQNVPDLDARVAFLVEGPLDPQDLDSLGQERCTALTRQILAAATAPTFMRSDAILAHARQFFHDFAPGGDATALDEALGGAGEGLRDYVCQLLLDVAAADRDLGEVGIAHGVVFLSRWGWSQRFGELAQRDLKLKAKDLSRITQQAADLVQAADTKPAGP